MSEDMPRSVTVSDSSLLEAGKEAESPVFTASDVAERVDLGLDGVRRRLKTMEKDGTVESKNVGARAVVWWVTESGRDRRS
jgi:predicted ArsR family transcriptional regulator